MQNSTVETIETIKARLDNILDNSRGQTDVLFSQDFTSKTDAYFETLSEENKETALVLLNNEYGPYPYFHETHDFDKEPFDEDGYCRHGLDRDTCPCGCGGF